MKRKTKPQIEPRPLDVKALIRRRKRGLAKAQAQLAQLPLWDDEFERQRRLKAQQQAERFWSQIRALEGKS